jgi:predicted deacylase
MPPITGSAPIARREEILTLDLPYCEQFAVGRTIFGSGGPRVAIVSGVHGDEVEGLYACHRLARWLTELCRARPEALLGTVELYPGLNPLGLDTLQRGVPIFDVDLNRTFPGDDAGVLPQRVAAATMAHLDGAAMVVDIHASNIYLREIPQVRINRDFADRLVPLARNMNLDVIWVHGAVTVLETTLAHSLNARGVPCLVVEMGVGMRLTPEFTEQLIVGILGLWQELGVLDRSVFIPRPDRTPLLADDTNVYYLNAETSGLFVPAVEHWRAVDEGQVLGSIVSPDDGETLSQITSPVEGVLFTLREYPLVYEGSLMARIVATDRVPRGTA